MKTNPRTLALHLVAEAIFAFIIKKFRTMKKSLLILGIFSLLANSVIAQTEQRESKYGIETDILWPLLVQTTRTHFTVKLWQEGHLRGDVYVGINIDFPRERETEGRFADYSLASGYRQYFWKGLHAEFSQTTGLGVLQNHVTTGKTYNSFDWLITGYVGYKFEFEFAHKNFYILPQFGVAGVIYKSNPWPIYEDKTLTKEVGESPFLLGSLRLGFNF
ncbi:MAG: hypothetical protein ACOVSW_13920 [Candidatus Kapaibacteriota bacterium]|jgi:hypothetical protein